MAKRGPKPAPANVVEMRGTGRGDRVRSQVVVPINGEPERPRWLTGVARKVWEQKVARYVERGQDVTGCEDALAQYCKLEATLIDMWRKDFTPTVAMVNAHRVYASEFFDTPASQHQSMSKAKGSKNPFAGNGRRPQS